MNKRMIITAVVLVTGLLVGGMQGWAAEALEKDFANPPDSAKSAGYWWWLNNRATKAGITRDLEEFKAKGIGGVLMAASSGGGPQGPRYLSPEWRELYKFTLAEANRLGLEVGVNLCGGWSMGGPWIPPELSGRWFIQSETTVVGPARFSGVLSRPRPTNGYDSLPHLQMATCIRLPAEKIDYRDTAVVAFREPDGGASKLNDDRKRSLPAKSIRLDGNCFIPARSVMDPPQVAWANQPSDHPIPVSEVIDLTAQLAPDGRLDWQVPEGTWTILRTGHRLMGARVMVAAKGGEELEVDWLSRAAVDRHWEHLVEILLADAGPLAGRTLKYLHTDSFEDGYPNWTARMLDEFKRYRGYDPTPYLPVFAGRIVGSAEISDRFLHDYRKTVADCMADNNYGYLRKRANEVGLQLQAEAAGPSWSGTACMDGLKNLGHVDRPMGEFWTALFTEKTGGKESPQIQNKVCKQVASAAHLYGSRTVSAEAFTSSLPPWSEFPALLKPIANRAFCEGINRVVFHTMTTSDPADGLPGYEYFAGTHFNPNVTWWRQMAGAWISFINRCQSLLQSGLFVADVLYYNGDGAPNLVESKHVDPALGKGYDYDVCNAEVLLTRLSVKDRRLVLPDGMSYRLLVLPQSTRMPVEVIRKLKALVEAGATIVGPRPESDPGLKDYPRCDSEVKAIAAELWSGLDGKSNTMHEVGKGRVVWGKPLRDLLTADGVAPDFEYGGPNASIDFIHRSTGEAEVYYLSNRRPQPQTAECRFRVAGKAPELWDPVAGTMRDLPEYAKADGITSIPLQFEPDGSMFVVFRKPLAVGGGQLAAKNFPEYKSMHELTGAWNVQFDPQWFYPDNGTGGKVKFEKLEDWSNRPEEAVKYYSGTATYRQSFDLQSPIGDPKSKIFLDLGTVKETARVRLNGKDLGVVWCAPWRVEITGTLKEKGNELEIEVVNLWPNRLIGDGKLPQDQRRTRTCVGAYHKAPKKGEHKLLSSGLLGPVRLMAEQ